MPFSIIYVFNDRKIQNADCGRRGLLATDG